MHRHIMIFGILSSLFGCGDGKPGLFSSNGYHIGPEKVWYRTSLGPSYHVSEVVGADPKTFVVQTLSSKTFEGTTAYYGMDRTSIFWTDTKIAGADPESFEYVCGDYSKDKNAVYYMADLLTPDVAHFSAVTHQFVKDANHVYFGKAVFSDDPEHFTSVGDASSNYFKDSKRCWYDIYELKNADPATFRYLGTQTAADANRLYQEMNEVEGADIKTYQILSNGYARDARSVYQKGVRMEGVNPGAFRVLNDHYSLDDKHCYYFMNTIPGADPATFQLIGEFYAKDARQVFTIGKPIDGADPATFRVLNGPAGCTCDAHHAYCMEKKINGVDPRDFPATGNCKSCNESGVEF